jgi:hypothetical protein
MTDDKAFDCKHPTESVSSERVEELMIELKNRLMLVTDHTLNHLKSHGVIPIDEESLKMLRANGCCKPDGGTCCVNKNQ